MPRAGGIFSLVPGYFATDGTTIEVSHHNPVFEDVAQALTDSLPRDGSAPMTGNLAMGSNKITGLAAGTNPADAVRFDQLPTVTPTTATLTAGTNAQGQGAITTDQVTITVAAANPSGATLPTAVAGKRVIIANRGANPVNIYPATGAAIGALAANAPVLMGVNQSVEFFARSATQWEGQISQPLDTDVTAIAALAGTGIAVRTAANTWAQRQITSSNGSVTITNPAGVAGDIDLSEGGLFFRLNSASAGTNGTSAQGIFPLSVTLEASSVYEYQLFYSLSRTAGSTGHDFSTLFGGTATLNNIYRDITAQGINTAATTAASVSYFGYRLSAAAQILVTGLASTTTNVWVTERGTVSINGAGTFIPQYQLSAAPGGAYSTNAGSFFRLRRLGASGADNTQGSWA